MIRTGESTILVVDDDPAIRQTLADVLEMDGYAVAQAANGAEALTRIEHAPPGLVLLDMRMPIMDGWTFARALRERGLRLPVIVMTAAQNARTWAREIEADDFLAKPFELDDLLSKVRRLHPDLPPRD
jgi:CheY-like chemotaxis protein